MVVGGGPAGLFAAETLAKNGAEVLLCEANPSVGRKFLVAGRGGLNLTHSDSHDIFLTRYSGVDMPVALWPELLAEFDNVSIREWAAGLGIETFQASNGRIYPREMKAAPLLRRWVERLRALGVQMKMRHRLTQLVPSDDHLALTFETPVGPVEYSVDAVILALGGGSWPITGSDGKWVPLLESLGVAVRPLVSANCGWELDWSPEVLEMAEGKPLKNIAASAGMEKAVGELLVTKYGLEGGVIYQLGPALRGMNEACLSIDLKPAFTHDQLLKKMESVRCDFLSAARIRWKLSDAAFALLRDSAQHLEHVDVTTLAYLAKNLCLPLLRPRPLAEAISSAGGVSWKSLTENFSLSNDPRIFLAGEMIDWEAPTGGYLMQGCFATAHRAALRALAL